MPRRFEPEDKWSFAVGLEHDYEHFCAVNPGRTARVQFLLRRLIGYERSLRFNEYGKNERRQFQRKFQVLDSDKAKIESIPEVPE